MKSNQLNGNSKPILVNYFLWAICVGTTQIQLHWINDCSILWSDNWYQLIVTILPILPYCFWTVVTTNSAMTDGTSTSRSERATSPLTTPPIGLVWLRNASHSRHELVGGRFLVSRTEWLLGGVGGIETEQSRRQKERSGVVHNQVVWILRRLLAHITCSWRQGGKVRKRTGIRNRNYSWRAVTYKR